MSTHKSGAVVINGNEWQLAHIEEDIAECKQLQWQKQKWFCTDALVYLNSKGEHSGSAQYRGQPYNGNNTIFVKGGWKHDHCSICWWTLYESDDPKSNTGYVSGSKWLCCECYDKFIAPI